MRKVLTNEQKKAKRYHINIILVFYCSTDTRTHTTHNAQITSRKAIGQHTQSHTISPVA